MLILDDIYIYIFTLMEGRKSFMVYGSDYRVD